jgi:hypothetical protein
MEVIYPVLKILDRVPFKKKLKFRALKLFNLENLRALKTSNLAMGTISQ